MAAAVPEQMATGGEPVVAWRRKRYVRRYRKPVFPGLLSRRSRWAQMDCQEYLLRFSDHLDGRTAGDESERIEMHRSECDRCSRYSQTLEAGRSLLQTMPDLDVPPDFRARLNHRIFHLEDGAQIARESSGSAATMASVFTMALLLAVSAWAPALGSIQPSVELPAVVVGEPPTPDFTLVPYTPTFPRDLSIFTTTEFQDGIWGDSHDLLREYAPILDRRRPSAHVRVGIE